MRVSQTIRPVSEILGLETQINLNPLWQRGAVWTPERQALLIDSMLRAMDVPKIYLLQCAQGAPFTYEAVDGQQRLRAMFSFRRDDVALTRSTEALLPINGEDINGRVYSTLSKDLRDQFNNFEICVSEIEPTDYDDVRSLFLRLQMGVSLSPAELRNSMNGPLRQVVDLIGSTHNFFNEARINAARFKRQDYLAHLFTVLASPGVTSVKAPDLLRAYQSMTLNVVEQLSPRVLEVLDLLEAIQSLAAYRMSQKWIFLDVAWNLADRLEAGQAVDVQQLAAQYTSFERRRKQYLRNPELLLAGSPTMGDQALYSYINAFVASGADRARLVARRDALRVIFSNLVAA